MFKIIQKLAEVLSDKIGVNCYIEPLKVVPDIPHLRLSFSSVRYELNGLQATVSCTLRMYVRGANPQLANEAVAGLALRLARFALSHRGFEVDGLDGHLLMSPGGRSGWSVEDGEKNEGVIYSSEWTIDLEFDSQELEEFIFLEEKDD